MTNQDDYQRGFDDGVAAERKNAAEIYGRGAKWGMGEAKAERDRYKKALEEIAHVLKNWLGTRFGESEFYKINQILEETLKEVDEPHS